MNLLPLCRQSATGPAGRECARKKIRANSSPERVAGQRVQRRKTRKAASTSQNGTWIAEIQMVFMCGQPPREPALSEAEGGPAERREASWHAPTQYGDAIKVRPQQGLAPCRATRIGA